MSEPTPEPDPSIDPNDTALAEEENPAEGGNDTHWSEEQAGLDPDDVSPEQSASQNSQDLPLENTDTGQNG